MTDTQLIKIGMYNRQQVYYDVLKNEVYLEKDGEKLVQPNVQERKGLIDSGLIKVINDIIKEVNLQVK